MGLISAGLGAINGVLADQWKEFFYCDALSKDTLVVKGQKKISSRSSNTKGNDNVISNGSVIAVADGQCMIIVDQGKISEICAEPGEFVWNNSTEPSIFTGSLGESVKNTFKLIGRRFTFGGDPGKDQRVYYFNIKEITENAFGTPNPVPFRVVDSRIGLDIDVSVRCHGMFSYKVSDPILFYTNVCGNVSGSYSRSEIDEQLKAEFIGALQPAFAELSNLEMRPNQIIAHNPEVESAMNNALSKKWGELRGLKVVSVSIKSLTLPEEDQELIKEAQKNAMYRDPTYAAATLVGAQAEAMKNASSNPNGAAVGFMGMNMAMNAGGAAGTQGLYEMGQQQAAQKQAEEKARLDAMMAASTWKCACGASATGKFCPECGAKKPDENGWKCSCGAVNKGKFCENCGAKKPEDAPLYKCDKCGWEPADPHNPPKFCPECGDPFDESDKI